MLNSNELNLIENIIIQFKTRLELPENMVVFNHQIDEEINGSSLFHNKREVNLHMSAKVLNTRSETVLSFAKVVYSIPNGKYNLGSAELQIIGYKKLKKNYGHIIIRPESFEDKISEFFSKSEIDFAEYPKFSSRYYFLSQDKNLAEIFSTHKRLTFIENAKELLIEIRGNTLIANFARALNLEDYRSMLDFIYEV